MFGEEREYLTIKILHNDMTVMVPCENAGMAGLRRVIDEETVKKVLAVLPDDVSEMPKNWNRRFKHNRDKIKTGDIYELAEVVRNLAIREHEKGLSTGEKQMFTRAKKILASELMYALEMDEEEAEAAPRRPAAGVLRGEHRRGLTRRRSSMAVALVVAAGRGERLGSHGPKAFVVGGRPPHGRVEPRRAARRAGDRARRRRAPARGRGPAGDDGRGRRGAALALRRRRARRRGRGRRRARPRRRAPAGRARPRGPLPGRARRRGRRTAAPDAVIAAAPMTDTVKEAGEDHRVVRTLDRARLWAVQTPQVFRRAALERALRGRRRRRWRARPTTRRSSRPPGAWCASSPRRGGTSR